MMRVSTVVRRGTLLAIVRIELDRRRRREVRESSLDVGVVELLTEEAVSVNHV